jgi:hypothetical protein
MNENFDLHDCTIGLFYQFHSLLSGNARIGDEKDNRRGRRSGTQKWGLARFLPFE